MSEDSESFSQEERPVFRPFTRYSFIHLFIHPFIHPPFIHPLAHRDSDMGLQSCKYFQKLFDFKVSQYIVLQFYRTNNNNSLFFFWSRRNLNFWTIKHFQF